MRKFVKEYDGQVGPAQVVGEFDVAVRNIEIAPGIAAPGHGGGQRLDTEALPAYQNRLGRLHCHVCRRVAARRVLVARARLEVTRNAGVQPGPRLGIALHELDQAGGKRVREAFFRPRVVNAVDVVRQTNDFEQEVLHEALAGKTVMQTDHLQVDIRFGQVCSVLHLLARGTSDGKSVRADAQGNRYKGKRRRGRRCRTLRNRIDAKKMRGHGVLRKVTRMQGVSWVCRWADPPVPSRSGMEALKGLSFAINHLKKVGANIVVLERGLRGLDEAGVESFRTKRIRRQHPTRISPQFPSELHPARFSASRQNSNGTCVRSRPKRQGTL